jgi:eukaryotic-like serine/threonine-protein kinase
MYCRRCHRRYEEDELFCPQDGERLLDRPHVKHVRAKPTDLTGTVLGGRYQIRGLLGRGALAQVFLAKDTKTAEPVAVKVLEAKHLKEPRTRARFILEAKAMADVTHPNIAAMLDVGLRDDGAPYIVLEYLLGESMGDWLRREKRMDPQIGVPLLRQLAHGLSAAHGAGIIHRDIKPDNVFLVGEKGEPHTAKIVDFGLARVAEQRGLTQYGVAVGTIEFMAPEQAVGDDADPRTDVYGLGVLMYRMFAGRLPFKFDEEALVMAHHLAVPPPPPALGDGRTLRDLEAVIVKALRKKKENRYQSMDALDDDLARVGAERSGLVAHRQITTPDEYLPVGAFAEKAAAFLHKRLAKASLG